MGVIMTIAIASIATIHIGSMNLNQKHNNRMFGAARREINQDAYFLIWLFVGQLGLLIVRSYFAANEMALSFFDGAAIIVFLASIITLLDVLGVMRALTPS